MSLRPRSPQPHGESLTGDDSHSGQPHHAGGDTMTAPRSATIERLYVSDDELPAVIGVDKEALGVFLRMLDRNPKSGFPRRDPMLGNKRYLPKVRAWFDDYNRLNPQAERKSA